MRRCACRQHKPGNGNASLLEHEVVQKQLQAISMSTKPRAIAAQRVVDRAQACAYRALNILLCSECICDQSLLWHSNIACTHTRRSVLHSHVDEGLHKRCAANCGQNTGYAHKMAHACGPRRHTFTSTRQRTLYLCVNSFLINLMGSKAAQVHQKFARARDPSCSWAESSKNQ